jgi:hypothetical protein
MPILVIEIAERRLMETGLKVQQRLFQLIKDTRPHLSLADAVEEILSVGQDSAYRRISGKTELTLSELHKLCHHFSISADELLYADDLDQITFSYKALDEHDFTLLQYLQTAYERLKMMAISPKCQLIYSAVAMPLFDYFLFDKIGAFKLFVWQKSICGFKSFANRKFDFDKIDPRLLDTGRKLLKVYQHIPSAELWNMSTIDSLLNQLEYYAETNQFANPEDAQEILGQIERYLAHISKQAELGYKFPVGGSPTEESGAFEMYHNEVVTADNTILVDTGTRKYTFLTHCATNFLNTGNEHFCETTYSWLSNLIKRSTLISKASEKQRTAFFNQQNLKVKRLKEKINYLVSAE